MRYLFPVCLALAGCAPVSFGPPVVTDVPKGSEVREIPATARDAKIDQNGLIVTVALMQHCMLARFDTTERTSVRTAHNDAPVVDVLAALGGSFLVGSGITGVARPSTGSEIDASLSNAQTRGISYGLIAAGIALLAVPIIDYNRSHGVIDTRVARVSTAAGIVEDDRPCGAPPKGTEVFARFPTGKDAYLGATDGDGHLTANLDTATGSDFRLVRGEHAAIHADGVDVGMVSIDALYTLREEAAWKKLKASACPSSLTETDCSGESSYADLFPEGDHITETKHRLEDATKRRKVAAERIAFARLDLGGCKTPVHVDDTDACGPLEAFRRSYPESAHTAEVENALVAGRTARLKLDEAEAKAAAQREKEQLDRAQGQHENGYPSTNVIVPYAGGRRTVPAPPRRRGFGD